MLHDGAHPQRKALTTDSVFATLSGETFVEVKTCENWYGRFFYSRNACLDEVVGVQSICRIFRKSYLNASTVRHMTFDSVPPNISLGDADKIATCSRENKVEKKYFNCMSRFLFELPIIEIGLKSRRLISFIYLFSDVEGQ